MKDPRRYFGVSLVLDAVLVILFAVMGRASHGESLAVAGVVQVAWPFLVGTAIGWLATFGWRRPLSIVKTGIGVWVATVAIGMLLRWASDQDVQGTFVVVASVVLAIFLLGWRAIALLVLRRPS